MSAKEDNEPTFYQSDSPCRRCNGTTRYRNTANKGKCATCCAGDDRERQAKNWIVTSGMQGVGKKR